LEADLRAPARTAPIFTRARLRTEMSFDRRRGRFELSRAQLTSDALDMQAQGWTNRSDGEFAGEWRVNTLAAFSRDMQGQIGGRWRAFAQNLAPARGWTVTIQGAGERVGGAPQIVPQLLGSSPRLDARLRAENGGLTISHARIDGAKLRAA